MEDEVEQRKARAGQSLWLALLRQCDKHGVPLYEDDEDIDEAEVP